MRSKAERKRRSAYDIAMARRACAVELVAYAIILTLCDIVLTVCDIVLAVCAVVLKAFTVEFMLRSNAGDMRSSSKGMK